jgi:non-specific serine/threonine protein kinase/serine/threonine-protein kinase
MVPNLDQELLRRTDELVEVALRLPKEDRERYLRAKTQNSPGLFTAALHRMKQAEASNSETAASDPGGETSPTQDSGGLDTQPISSSLTANSMAPGASIGNFVIEKLLAQGGMGAVYLASQVEEGFRRHVALKVVKPELASRGVLQRFLQERQVLAGLDHPNVARLVDAGTTREGAPYLVMEYVEGQRIDEYCEAHQLQTRERIRLFLTVCEAVQYAHQRLVIHRDIKPSNILVTGEGVVKLLDFGIAKIMARDEEETVLLAQGLTTGGEAPMTPMYASPEQVRGDTVTTSTDIYSLALMLYELLTGSLPYEFKQLTAAGVERTICEVEPLPPSQASITRPLFRGETQEKVRDTLRGELDVILLMALRKEPDRRYLSVHQFAEDLQRYLDGLPVRAHKDTVGYRMQKFIRRHRAGVAAAVLVAISLAASTVISAYFAQVARHEKNVAERRFQETRELARYVVTDLDDAIRRGETAARGELVEKGLVYLKRLSEEAAGDLSLQREVLRGYVKMGDILGNPFTANLGQRDRARASYQEALAIGQRYGSSPQSGPLQPEMALLRRKLADLDAEALKLREALDGYLSVVGQFKGLDLGEIRSQIGWVRSQQGKHAESLEDYRAALQLAAAALQENPWSARARDLYARAGQRVGECLLVLQRLPEAEESLRAAVEAHESRVREEPDNSGLRRGLLSATLMLGEVLARAGKTSQAEATLRRAVNLAESQQSADPTNTQYRTDRFIALGRLVYLLESEPSRRAAAHQVTQQLIRELRPLVVSGVARKMELDQYLWLILATPFPDLQDPAAALPLVEAEVARSGGQDARVLDMLARAQAGVGRFAEAVTTEERALALLDPAPTSFRAELEANHRRFQAMAKRR